MRIQTKYLGDLAIDESKIIQFPAGLPGFINETGFVLLDLPDNPVFQILQSVSSADTAFIVTNPYHIYRDYSFDLDNNLMESLEISNEKDVTVLTIVTLKKPFQTSTLNLKAPIIINPNSKLGKQYILNVDDYPTKASIAPGTPEKVKGE
ncbi:flagellar assembly protein FliW [Virgibacillus profundi]|uniref:Flagellar assembly factor FliW n=1 Tax=Virgibacillus profundi TaxID=2024555 RepID=A0A2A2II30_9BACI|nr:flagellar assembly protein FliW [Virgibacillus profundi]PAV31018.1 flagellar assembly protein FliW [Virgibacillus profundi]PXY55203.1 flagellar assembly protein FliW [Virgibacillus profundi]